MPRKPSPSPAEKRQWLEAYEAGKPETTIARQSRRDVRTVKRGIQDALHERDIRLARIELIREALRKHQESLMAELEALVSAARLPPWDWDPLSWRQKEPSMFLAHDAVEIPHPPVEIPGQDRARRGEPKTMRDLLKDHLRNDRLWTSLANWQKAYEHNAQARIALQRKTVALLVQKTGYPIVDRGGKAPFLYSLTAGGLLFQSAIGRTLAPERASDLERDLIINGEAGTVEYREFILARVPGEEEICRRKLLEVCRELQNSLEVREVSEAFRELEEATGRVKEAAEHIRMLGLIPGQCRICRRLGM